MKFKIIENDRFLKIEEMGKVKGGLECPLPYTACTPTRYLSCDLEVVPTFKITECHGGLTYLISCSGGATYRQCIVTANDSNFSCSGNFNLHF